MIASGCEKAQTSPQLGASIFPNVSSNETKGKIITTAGINQADQTFAINGYLDASIASAGEEALPYDKTHFHFVNDVMKCNGSSWDWQSASGVDANRPKWRAGIPIRFWCSYPAVAPDGLSIIWPHDITVGGDTPTNVQQKAVAFTYELPAPAGADPEDSLDPFKDAENQIDLLFAYNDETRFFKRDAPYDETAPLIVDTGNPGNKGSRNDEKIDIHFYHVLSAVNFDITTVDGTVDLASITINHVRYSGNCAIDGPSLAAPVAGASGAGTGGVTWSNLSADFKDFSQSFTRADFETLGTAPNTYERQKVSGSKTFFMIPQTLSGASLTIAFNYKSGGVPISLTHNLDADTWLPGKIYTYSIKLTASGGVYTLLDVSLDVKDWVDGSMETSF